ncbi:YeeE/YedE family protein [Sphingorhabdus soli]|uniref:YeeE/YedE family protein n=1 Tax=Flavisphingopyxis soli TaxID=2601267 RepID=A0A5C6UQU2_9SPHN|nr:YeeE/YedE thiosulfate transporter family protein [Sphingorhabdus soli]TXC73395.1 YeeE/YedE family protein [Sphingorhabdus soli]
MAEFNALTALAGGLMIGIAAGAMLLLLGRIAGVSGMSAQALGLSRGATSRGIAAAFIIGLPLGATLPTMVIKAPAITVTTSVPLLIAGGLLVGFGTRLGNGCTSGHGVCGMARLSRRSIAATASFMAAGFVTVFVLRHLLEMPL